MSSLSADTLPPPDLGGRPTRGDRWLLVLAVVCAGYILLGRSFAYVGVAPLYIGEVTIALGAACFVTLRHWRRVLELSLTWVLLALIALGLLRTLPYVGEYQIDALRDFMLLGYASVALLVAGVILDRPERLALLLAWYRRAAPWLVASLPVIWLSQHFIGEFEVPVLGMPPMDVKAGDGQVHLAGALAFWCAGLAAVPPLWALAAMSLGVPVMGAFNRGGLVSFGLIACLCVGLRPRSRTLRTVIIVAFLLGSAALVADVTVRVPGADREASAQQLASNLVSIFGGHAEGGGLSGTKEWRLTWWRTIADYTLFGEHFWTGKGFGVNLADDDGFQVSEDGSLRSPHNGHFTVLARTGVPGLTMWLVALATWFGMLARGWWISRLRGDVRWNSLFLFLGCYGLAFVLNASFDVFLEGPMGAIPFWTVVGTGMAATWCYRHRPEVLDEA